MYLPVPSPIVKYKKVIVVANTLVNKQQLDKTEPKMTATLGPNLLIIVLASGPKMLKCVNVGIYSDSMVKSK